MHNIEQVIRRLRLSGSGVALSAGEARMLFIHLIKKVEDLENEISLCRSEASGESRETVSAAGPKLRGRGRPKSESKSSSPSGSEGIDSKT
jgi:hypothetical protein